MMRILVWLSFAWSRTYIEIDKGLKGSGEIAHVIILDLLLRWRD
jgi:hypothetical protein